VPANGRAGRHGGAPPEPGGPRRGERDPGTGNPLEKSKIGVATVGAPNLGDRFWGALARPRGLSVPHKASTAFASNRNPRGNRSLVPYVDAREGRAGESAAAEIVTLTCGGDRDVHLRLLHREYFRFASWPRGRRRR
jgi:hypothetical protein